MIKFFRNIRKKLLKEGKTTNYLKYAIGEIVLVVIGILIALQINNWNENNLKRKTEIQFYKNTKQQLLDDASNIKSQIDYNSTYLNQFKYAIKLIEENNRNQRDSLGIIALNLLAYSDFDRQGNIYETIVNSGDVKLIRNKEIIDALRLLEETYIYVNRMETIHFNALMEMVPYLNQVLRFTTMKVENIEMLYNYQFQNHFTLSIRIMEEKNVTYNRALTEINSIVKLLNTEINK